MSTSLWPFKSTKIIIYIFTGVKQMNIKAVTLFKINQICYLNISETTGSETQLRNPWWTENSPTFSPVNNLSLTASVAVSFSYNHCQPLTPNLPFTPSPIQTLSTSASHVWSVSLPHCYFAVFFIFIYCLIPKLFGVLEWYAVTFWLTCC